MPASQVLRCAACAQPLPVEPESGERTEVCRGCGASTRVAVFPARGRTPAGLAPEPIESENEASCFYHPRNRASLPCQECGRFLCHLCELRADGRSVCPVCFAAGLRTRKLVEFETRRTNYDTIALALTAPAIFIWPAIVSAPAALFMAIRYWNSPRGGVLKRTRVRCYLAVLLAVAEIAGLGAVIALIVRQAPFFQS